MWLHIDAAWAGVTLACPEYRETAQLPGINEYADSLCINFHKVTRSNETVYPYHNSNCSTTVILLAVGLDEFRRIFSLGP